MGKPLLLGAVCACASFIWVATSHATPIIYDSSYRIELMTTVPGSALHAMDIASNGSLYVSSYNDGNVYVVTSPSSPGTQAATQYSSGYSNANGLTITDDGRLFVSTGNGDIHQVYSDGTSSIFSGGHSYPTSLDTYSNDLYITNSGDGTISKVDGATAMSSTVVSGLSAPNGPYGLSIDGTGTLYFTDHATGGVYSSDLSGSISLLGSLTPFGVGYTGVNSLGELFVSDIITGEIHKIDSSGNMSLFASGFAGKSNPPFNGPHDYAFDGNGNMYISDAESIWRISAVPIPSALWLFGSGLPVLIGVARKKAHHAA